MHLPTLNERARVENHIQRNAVCLHRRRVRASFGGPACSLDSGRVATLGARAVSFLSKAINTKSHVRGGLKPVETESKVPDVLVQTRQTELTCGGEAVAAAARALVAHTVATARHVEVEAVALPRGRLPRVHAHLRDTHTHCCWLVFLSCIVRSCTLTALWLLCLSYTHTHTHTHAAGMSIPRSAVSSSLKPADNDGPRQTWNLRKKHVLSFRAREQKGCGEFEERARKPTCPVRFCSFTLGYASSVVAPQQSPPS